MLTLIQPEQKIDCRSCTLPGAAEITRLDHNGLCFYCRSQTEIVPQTDRYKTRLAEQIRKIKELGQGQLFDCVVGLSGGRDSAYLLHLLTEKHHLRCLAAYYRTPFTPDFIHANVMQLVKYLEVPLVKINISREVHRKMAREVILHWRQSRDNRLINQVCAPCLLVNREIFKIARATGIKTIIFGGNINKSMPHSDQILHCSALVPTTALRTTEHPEHSKQPEQLYRFNSFPQKSRQLWRHYFMNAKIFTFYKNLQTSFLQLRYPRIHRMYYFQYQPWHEKDCTDTLKRIGWESPGDRIIHWHADCSFAGFKSHLFREINDISHFELYFSNLVRAGQLTRKEALNWRQKENQLLPSRIAEIYQILDISTKKRKHAPLRIVKQV